MVWEIGGKIGKEYHHFFDGTLCLGTYIEVYRKFSPSPNIRNFIESLLIPYLYRYSYIQKFKEAGMCQAG
jgi:hypothetical protein